MICSANQLTGFYVSQLTGFYVKAPSAFSDLIITLIKIGRNIA